MASHKLAVLLRSTGRLSEDDIENMDEDEAWQWLRSNTPMPRQPGDEAGDDADI